MLMLEEMRGIGIYNTRELQYLQESVAIVSVYARNCKERERICLYTHASTGMAGQAQRSL